MSKKKKTENLVISNNSGQIIVQGKHNQQQQINATPELSALADLIHQLKANLSELPLEPDDRLEAETEIATVELQMSSNRPKRAIIRESLSTLRSLLEGIAGNLLTEGLLHQLESVLSLFP